MRFKAWLAVAVAGLTLLVAGCSSGGQGSSGGATGGVKGENSGMQGMMQGQMGGMAGMKMGEGEYRPPTQEELARVTRTVEITLDDQFRIQPKDITVKKGEVVKFVVKNVGAVPHDWMAEGIDELETGEFGGGEERVIVWEADRTGTFNTYCMVPGHKEAGMVGTLTVTD